MTSQERARRWLASWVPYLGEAAERALAAEFDTAQAEALLEGLKAASEPEPAPPTHEAWPNKHQTRAESSNWFRNESDVDSWP